MKKSTDLSPALEDQNNSVLRGDTNDYISTFIIFHNNGNLSS